MNVITEENWLIYATKAYDTSFTIGVSEFNEDLKIFMYVNKLLKRYKNSGTLNIRLLLNHIITLRNLFGGEYAGRLLLIYIDEDLLTYLYPILRFLDILNESWPEFNSSIEPDESIQKLIYEEVECHHR